MPNKIERLEAEKMELQLQTSNPDFYKQGADVIANTMAQMKKIDADLEMAYKRLDELL